MASEFQPLPARTLAVVAEPDVAPVTDVLFSRLTTSHLDEIEQRLSGEHRLRWDHTSAPGRKRLALAFGLYYDVPGVAEMTGLVPAVPPEGVHLMGRGMVEETGGAYYYADIVFEFLRGSDQKLGPASQVLDFSCSSGRVVRAMQAAYPGVGWYGCDPNVGAIEWAQHSIPGVNFFVSRTSPPLPFQTGSLDAVCAISVWSHYSASAALLWMAEMHRVIRPGGHLILTTHGLQACVWFSVYRDLAIEARLGSHWITDTVERLQRDGHCFWEVFGPKGDYGVIADDWGLSFFTPEWLLANVTPGWSLTMYRTGRAGGNQDVFALRRR
jgi:SAM-dependent methyltransferase